MEMNISEVDFIGQNLAMFCCPRCNGDLVVNQQNILCLGCGHEYVNIEKIPSLFAPNEWGGETDDVTEEIKSFYEKTPFPDYDDFDHVGSLISKAKEGLFARLLDEQIPFGYKILECGCGTGQLTNFLSIASRTVIGTDICINSLKMANDFKQANNLRRAHFYQMNLFRPAFRAGSFDLVISNGVLHHTSNPLLAFKSIASLVKPGGYILVGLYHRYGRLATDLRRFVFGLTGDRMRFLDQRLLNSKIGKTKKNSWFMDQYKNPHESKHTVGEVLNWLQEVNFKFIHAIPKTIPFEPFDGEEELFKQDRLGNLFERFVVNMGMIVTGHKEGGFFTIIAQRTP
ncbi:Methyltransferase type 11 [Thiothrix nivea DSM 5205]|uniref:Methyltransferase type 11 n=2 Tax=Thiothrix nivea TaxID=1031 RepID=A0A656HG33_THINJ|nr:Methyltransferase type 11 [Thiothrix nivea DSM 5205]